MERREGGLCGGGARLLVALGELRDVSRVPVDSIMTLETASS